MSDPTDEEYRDAVAGLPSNVRHRLRNELYAVQLGIHLVEAAYGAGDLGTAKQTMAELDEMIAGMMPELSNASN